MRACLFLLFLVAVTTAHAQSVRTSKEVQRIRPYTSYGERFQPAEFIVQGSHVLLAGRHSLTSTDDSLVGGIGETGRRYPQLICIDTNLRFQWEFSLKNEGWRCEFTQIEALSDSTFIVVLHGKKGGAGKKQTRLLVLNNRGVLLRDQPLEVGESEVYIQHLEQHQLLVGYTRKESYYSEGAEDSTRICLQLFDDLLVHCESRCSKAVRFGNGHLVNDALLLDESYVLATDLGERQTYCASVFVADERLRIDGSRYLFTEHNSEANKLLADGKGSWYIGANTYNYERKTGLALVKMNRKLETVFVTEFGECVHDDVTAMLLQNGTVVVAHEAGLIPSEREHMIDRSGITVFDTSGNVLLQRVFGSQEKQEKSVGLVALDANRLLLVNRSDESVERFDATGNYLSGDTAFSVVFRILDSGLNVVKQAEFGNLE